MWIVLICMGLIVCVAQAAEQSSQSSDETEAEQELVEEVGAAQEMADEEEAELEPVEEEAELEPVEEVQAEPEDQVEQLNLPEDTTPRLLARELQISGNALISTDELQSNMPAVYNASDQPLSVAASDDLYDLRVIHELITEPGLSREVSMRTIQGLTQYILSVYQDKDYSGIYVYVPEGAIIDNEELVDEILPIRVIEALVSEVKIKFYDVERNEVEKGYLRRSVLEKWSPAKPDRVASQRELDYLVNLLNLNPDRHVSAIVSKGAEPNTLAIEYNVYETDPWHYFIQADNSGTSDRQWSPRIGIINTNLLGIDDRFTTLYQFVPDSSFDDNYSLFGSYDFPLLNPRLRLNLYGGYSEFDINPEAGPIDFLGSGTFYGGILRYNVFQQQGWFFDIMGSWSHEESQITPSLFPQFFASEVEMELWGLGANLHRRDDMSTTSLSFNRVESLDKTDLDEFSRARTNADPEFSINYTAVNHSRYLDQKKVQQLRGTCRWIIPENRLVPAKMTSFGGMYSVRGYDEYEEVADGGILASIQYEFDLVRHSEAAEPTTVANEELKKLAPLAFFDYGRSKTKEPVAGENKHVEMYSIGVGMAFEIGDNFSGAIYYGYPLNATDDTRTGKGRLNASVMLRW
jgi:hemolysin activation/secretion protein